MSTRHKRSWPVVLVAVAVFGLVARVWAAKEVVELEQARIFIEYNSSANDLGFHIFLDGEDWVSLKIVSPDGKTIFDVKGKGGFKDLGMTELFFEGAEPSLDEVPLQELLALFPEGEYTFTGKTVDKASLVGTATLTHNVPDGPVIVSPGQGAVVDPDNVVVEWMPVTTPLGIQIDGYQVIVERENPHRVFTVDLPANATQVTVPTEFLQPGTAYNFEVLAKEIGGNQTITEGAFSTSAP